MKAEKMVPVADYLRLVEKCRKYRKAIKDQQKATLAWKDRALGKAIQPKERRQGRPDLAVPVPMAVAR